MTVRAVVPPRRDHLTAGADVLARAAHDGDAHRPVHGQVRVVRRVHGNAGCVDLPVLEVEDDGTQSSLEEVAWRFADRQDRRVESSGSRSLGIAHDSLVN